MKKIIVLICAFVICLSFAACSNVGKSSEKKLNGLDYVLDDSYSLNPIYEDVYINSDTPTGVPMSYDEVMDPDLSREGLTVLGYEIVSIYPEKEAQELTGKDYFNNIATLYKAHVYYDYVNDTEEDYYINISENGSAVMQRTGYPVYGIGQKIISPVYFTLENRGTTIGELIFFVYEVNKEELAYHLGAEPVKLYCEEYPNLVMDLAPEEAAIITTTRNNPAIFTQKSTVKSLTDFLVSDFKERGAITVEEDNVK